MNDKTLVEYTDVKRVNFSITENAQGYTAEGTLNIIVFMDGGFHHSFCVKARENKLVISEGFGYCPYIPNFEGRGNRL
jgi:hypothetical protein